MVEGPPLVDLLATHPVVLGIHSRMSPANVTRVLRPGIVRRALIVTSAGEAEPLAVALETPGILMPSGPKKKDAAQIHWLVCLPPIDGPRPEAALVRVVMADVEEILALATMHRAPPGDWPALDALAP
ncbi:hypothetical protein MKK68_02235 [Methylobacterium sp. E-016]|uniref:hypothetical protein n=1 Tax=Methylobacterium sp. E-016 TaxID=2836556 RepID=UPI001FB9AA56|nr:hypothetical protein [Methylobacterium sp. E-016]MCJ2074480.1 hypothetical protein [Methylobacterium sp. E-016]